MRNTIVQLKKWHAALLAGITVAILVLASPTLQAKAAQPEALPTADVQQLKLIYERLTLASKNQGSRLDFSKEIAGNAQEWVDDLSAAGVDVTALNTALSAFNAGITEAEGYHDTGAGILSTHSGFDDADNVTDVQAARETLRTAANNLRQAHLAITKATLDFRSAVRAWRDQHK
jgi:hypothetical protein